MWNGCECSVATCPAKIVVKWQILLVKWQILPVKWQISLVKWQILLVKWQILLVKWQIVDHLCPEKKNHSRSVYATTNVSFPRVAACGHKYI